MQLSHFTVKNYKVFKDPFNISFSTDSIAILTGRNNTGKSTLLEAINCFFKKDTTKTTTIPLDCYSDPTKEITFEAIFESDNTSIKFVKKYKEGGTPKYYDWFNGEIKSAHELRSQFDEIYENKPFYITPSMSTEDIHLQIQAVYSQILKNNLENLETATEQETSISQETREMREEYLRIKNDLPIFLRKLKTNTDDLLAEVSQDVSKELQGLFANDSLLLTVSGGESTGFSSNDILKSTSSTIYIDSHHQKEMPLNNQGTGLQRMSLIYLIQNMIQKELLGQKDNKMLLIDEPEAFLHPEAVRTLSRSLYAIGGKMPLIISTHSPILIDLAENHTSIQVLRVKEQTAIILYKSKTEQFDENDINNMKILNYADSYVNEFFFAEKILIVEGDTEFIALKHLMKENGVNIHIIRARGKSTICTLMKILNQFNASYDVLHDLDNHKLYSVSTLKAQLTNCQKIINLKPNDSVRVFASVSNFEQAIGIGDVSNSNKTKTVYEIINSLNDSPIYVKAREEINNFFQRIMSNNGSQPTSLGTRIIQVDHKDNYADYFHPLIESKS